MARIYTICLTDVDKDEAYKKTDSIKRSIMEAIKRDASKATKNDILPVITRPDVLRIICFNDRYRLKARIIPSTNPSDGIMLAFNDYELYCGMRYCHEGEQGLTFTRGESNKGYNQFLGLEYDKESQRVIINNGAFYKIKFSITTV